MRIDDKRAERRTLLHAVPVLRDGVAVEKTSDGLLALLLRIRRGNGFLDRFRPAVTERRYELDAFGAFVVRQIDRANRVIDIIGAFQERFGMSRRECELGVVAFLKMLVQREVVSVVSAGEASAAS
jgi:hypothetical protein